MNRRASAISMAGIALAALAFFLFLGQRGLNEPDEGRYAELGREMAAGSGWIVPHLNGFPHFQKPPMLYWATAASIRLFGVNEWAARLPSALAALGTLAATFVVASALLNRAVAISSVLVLASCVEFFAFGRVLTPDMMLTFWSTAALACFALSVSPERSRGWQWAFFVAMGLGFLTKGPMALVVPASAALAWQLASRGTPGRRKIPWGRGLLLALLIGLGWYVALSCMHPQLFGYFAGDELLKRFATHAHGRSKPFWFFVPVLLGGTVPWSFFLPAILISVWKRRRALRLSPAAALLAGWVLVPFVVLSFSGSKLPTYVLPLLPGVAISIACWWHAEIAAADWRGRLRAILAFCAGGLLLSWLFWIFVDYEPIPMLMKGWEDVLILCMPVVIGAVCVVLLREQRGILLPVLATGSIAMWLAVNTEINEENSKLRQQASVRPLARKLLSQPDIDHALVFSAEARVHGLEFYLRRCVSTTRDDADIVLDVEPSEQPRLLKNVGWCATELLAGRPAYGLVRTERFEEKFAPLGWREMARSGDFVLVANRTAHGAPGR